MLMLVVWCLIWPKLADIKKGIYIYDGMGKISLPCAKPLLAGNVEEEDSVFIEYVSAIDGDPQQKLDPKNFFENDNGIFINKLMEEKNDSGVFIPRPIKLCHPDWVLSYRGCPLAYGKGKMSWGDTTEGLRYTNLFGTNILNYITKGTPSIVMHTSNICITLQASRIDDNDETIAVYQRKGLPYFIEPSVKYPTDSKPTTPLPLLYCFKRVEKQYLSEDTFTYLNQRADKATKQHQQQFYKAEKALHSSYTPSETIESAALYDLQALYNHEDLVDSFLILMMDPEIEVIRRKWNRLRGPLQSYVIAIFEAIDVCVGIFTQ